MEAAFNFIEKNTTRILSILVVIGLLLMHQYSYLLYHTMVELITIGIAWAVFMLTYNSRDLSNDNTVTFIGIAYLFISILDLLHTLTFSGMNIFYGYDANLPTQLWIGARYVNSLSFLILPIIPLTRMRFSPVIFGYLLITGAILSSIFVWDIFPDCYIEGVGLTAFKIVSEYIICLILAASVILLRLKARFDKTLMVLLTWSLVLLILSELTFTFYLQVSDLMNTTGHLLKLISSFLIYKALIESGIRKPFSLLFRNLKESESNLINVNKLLEIELSRRQAAEIKLRSAVTELERSNKELEQFAYVASHDLQEPLRMISNFTKLLESRFKDNLDPKSNEYIWYIVDGSKRMSELISDLLTYSRVTAKTGKSGRTNLNSVIADILKDLQMSISESNVRMEIDTLPELNMESIHVKQLFQNLIQNAIKFRKNENPFVRISARMNENEWLITVMDNGIGIEKEHHDKIFLIFQRLHDKTRYAGSGIGLAICKKIVESYGGKIWVESEPGSGTSFHFTLPA